MDKGKPFKQTKITMEEINMKNIKILLIMALFLIGNIALVEALEVSVNNYDPSPAEAGKPVNVWFKVENPSDKAESDVYIEIIPKDGLELTSGEASRKKIGTLASRRPETIKYRLLVKKNAFKGSHSIEVLLSKGTSSALKKDLSIEVTDKDFKNVNLEVGDIESDPTRIKPDDENVKLEVTIQNLGDGKAQGVKAELIDLPKGITLSESYSGSSLLGNIEADSTSKATFYIDVDEATAPKEYTSYIKASYKYKPDEDEDDYLFEEKKIPLKIAIKPVPIYEITKVEISPTVLTAGDKDVKLRITIKNIGEEKGESVRIKAYGKTEQPIVFEKSSDFVAPALEPGESGQATLEFKIDEDANLQQYYLDIEIKNVVNDDVITYNKKIPVVIKNPKPNNPWKVVSIGVILIAAVGGYMWWKKKRKPKAAPKKIEGSYGKSYLDKLKEDKK